MKRRLILKIFGLAALYMAVFVLLAFVQFYDHSRLSKNIGVLRITGGIGRQKTGQAHNADNQVYAVKDDIKIVFPGIEFNLSNFIVSDGMEKALYNDITQKWLDTAFNGWERDIYSANAGEDAVTAYLAEAVRRGALKQAVGTAPPLSGGSTALTFLSAPFLGGLNTHLREFTASEREKMSLITSYTDSNSSAYLTEEKVFDYLARRGDTELFNRGIEYIGMLTPEAVGLDMCAGIFEGWLSWNEWRGNEDNPFGALVTNAFTLILTHIKKDGQNTSVFITDETIDVIYNIRLGAALAAYGETVMNNGVAAIGRSLIISALSFANGDGSISSQIELSGGDFTEAQDADRLSAAQVYRELGLSGFYPHAAGFGQTISRVWAWTASPSIKASFQSNTLDIYVDFPLGETHYIYIFNVPPFSKIQMRNMDYRSDPRFEQYSAPGWLYSIAEQVLMLKMVQQTSTELIRIMF